MHLFSTYELHIFGSAIYGQPMSSHSAFIYSQALDIDDA